MREILILSCVLRFIEIGILSNDKAMVILSHIEILPDIKAMAL